MIGSDSSTGAQLGLHPGFIGFKNLYDLGKLAVIQGCGYPEYSLSHEQSRGIWQTANPLGVGALAGTGWVGRHLASNYGATDIPGVAISLIVLAVNFLSSWLRVVTDPQEREKRHAAGATTGRAAVATTGVEAA